MLHHLLTRLARDEQGATFIEYALVASMIAVALSATFLALGNEVNSHYEKVETEYHGANQ